VDLKEFEKLLKICRKHGVLKVELEGVKAEFTDLPPSKKEIAEADPEVTAEPSMDELIYYAVQGEQ